MIPEKEKKLAESEVFLQDIQKNGKSFLRERVTEDDIAAVISKWTGIPAQKLLESEKEKLLHLEDMLAKQVVGQDSAISAVAHAIRRARVGLADASKPLASFLFLGPTGV